MPCMLCLLCSNAPSMAKENSTKRARSPKKLLTDNKPRTCQSVHVTHLQNHHPWLHDVPAMLPQSACRPVKADKLKEQAGKSRWQRRWWSPCSRSWAAVQVRQPTSTWCSKLVDSTWFTRSQPAETQKMLPKSYKKFDCRCRKRKNVTKCLVGGLEHFLFSIIYGIILPIEKHVFQDGYCTTNQKCNSWVCPVCPILGLANLQVILTKLPERFSGGYLFFVINWGSVLHGKAHHLHWWRERILKQRKRDWTSVNQWFQGNFLAGF